jgi:2,4-dienoyl-CoA reductase-like NADH-dependent reductase (Old Yellow Enzyme family)
MKPLQAGAFQMKNRMVLAPLTRCRAINDRIPNKWMVEYYRQRSGAGMILSEATAIDPMGVGYPNTPGIWSAEQVVGWKDVTEAVHKEGGLIVCQLWHVGRISHPSYLNGEKPVAPSAIKPEGHVSLVRPITEYEVPRALETEEIPGIVSQYRRAAKLAKEAGFDGVEVHGANGYLLDQFLHEKSNTRTDQYGGSIPNRSRLLLEVCDTCIEIWGKDRVGMHLAPKADTHDVGSSDLSKLFGYVADELAKRGIAFICARETYNEAAIGPELKRRFGGVYIANEGFTKTSAEVAIESGIADAVAFGKSYIANPDLVKRFVLDAELNEPDPSTFFGDSPKGYTDYPTLSSNGNS